MNIFLVYLQQKQTLWKLLKHKLKVIRKKNSNHRKKAEQYLNVPIQVEEACEGRQSEYSKLLVGNKTRKAYLPSHQHCISFNNLIFYHKASSTISLSIIFIIDSSNWCDCTYYIWTYQHFKFFFEPNERI